MSASRPHLDLAAARLAITAWRRGDAEALARHIDGAVRWRRHPRLGPIAARVLEIYDREIARALAELLLAMREQGLEQLGASSISPPPTPPPPGRSGAS